MTSAERWIAFARLSDIPLMSARGFVHRVPGAITEAMASRIPDDLALLGSDDDPNPDASFVPWSLAKRVAVHDESVRRELLARRYDNFDPGELDVVVRADLFDSSFQALDSLGSDRQWSADVDLDREFAQRLDRRVGAACGLLAVPVPASDAVLRDAVAARLLSSAEPAIAGVLAALGVDDNEVELLTAMVRLVEGVDPAAAFGARAAVERLLEDVPEASPSARDLRRIGAVIRGERDLPEFRSGSGRLLPKAILMMVTRPDPHDAMSWVTAARDDAITVALNCAFAGLRSGWSRLPSDWKVGRPWRMSCEAAICDGLGGGGSAWAASLGHPVGAIVPAGPAAGERAGAPEEPVESPSSDAGPLRALLANAEVAAATARICEARGWDDLVTSILEPKQGTFSFREGHIVVDGTVTVRYLIDGTFVERWDPGDGEVDSLTLAGIIERLSADVRSHDLDVEDKRTAQKSEKPSRRAPKSPKPKPPNALEEGGEGTLFDQA